MYHLDQGASGWLHKTANRNYWKVRHVYDELDDLTQDGYLCWYICANKYEAVTDYGHLMRLFQTTFSNHITWTARTDKGRDFQMSCVRILDLFPPDQSERAEAWILDKATQVRDSSIFPNYCDWKSVNHLIAEAKEPVRSVLSFLTSDVGARALRRPFRRRINGTRETLSQRICRNLGIPTNPNLLDQTKAYLANSL